MRTPVRQPGAAALGFVMEFLRWVGRNWNGMLAVNVSVRRSHLGASLQRDAEALRDVFSAPWCMHNLTITRGGSAGVFENASCVRDNPTRARVMNLTTILASVAACPARARGCSA